MDVFTPIAEALKSLFGKLADFFDILDLSFFVSGAVCLAALMLAVQLCSLRLPFETGGPAGFLALLVSCYVLGLACFAIGRWSRRILAFVLFKDEKLLKNNAQFGEFILSLVRDHGMNDEAFFAAYLRDGDRAPSLRTDRLYTRLWAEVRQDETLAPSLTLLRKYWVLSATYDGLASASGAWIGVFAMWKFNVFDVIVKSGDTTLSTPALPWAAAIIAWAVLLLAMACCILEADRYRRFQAEELVATIVHRLRRAAPK